MTIKAPALTHRGGKEANMKFQHGMWWYKGKSYNSLHEALTAIWPRK